jgi:hypothetical protein
MSSFEDPSYYILLKFKKLTLFSTLERCRISSNRHKIIIIISKAIPKLKVILSAKLGDTLFFLYVQYMVNCTCLWYHHDAERTNCFSCSIFQIGLRFNLFELQHQTPLGTYDNHCGNVCCPCIFNESDMPWTNAVRIACTTLWLFKTQCLQMSPLT